MVVVMCGRGVGECRSLGTGETSNDVGAGLAAVGGHM